MLSQQRNVEGFFGTSVRVEHGCDFSLSYSFLGLVCCACLRTQLCYNFVIVLLWPNMKNLLGDLTLLSSIFLDINFPALGFMALLGGESAPRAGKQ